MLVERIEDELKGKLEKLSGEKVFLDIGKFGDLSTPLAIKVGKRAGRDPSELAERWAEQVDVDGVRVEAVKGFLNFYLTDGAIVRALGELGKGSGKGTAVVEYSSPNIAKPFSLGHLRSTVIGESLRRILEFRGWKVHGLNFYGDWGTQFGKLMAAYRRWPVDLSEEPIKKLFELYVRFHREENDELAEEAREEFRKLERGDEGARKLWQKFRELSIKEFQRIYDLLEISPLEDYGESRWVERGKELADELLKKGIAQESEGAIVVPVEGKPPLILRKKDGTTIYATRDLAAGIERFRKYRPQLMVYVVGNEQKLHFEQLFSVMRRAGVSARLEHVGFGLIRLPEGKMSTRKGRVVFLEDVLREAIERVKAVMKEPDDEIARIIGTGAVKFADLRNNRSRDIVFSWDMLSLEGETGPYVQYAAVRAKRVVEKFGKGKPGLDEQTRGIARKLALFRLYVRRAEEAFRPDILANYLLEIAREFNELYARERLGDIPERLWIAEKTGEILEKGLWLLGIRVPERM